MPEATALDALIAELLGDVGKLHDSVNRLQAILPDQINQAEARLKTIIELLQVAGDGYQTALQKYTQDQGNLIRQQMEQDAAKAASQLQDNYRALMEKSQIQLQDNMRITVNNELKELEKKLQKVTSDQNAPNPAWMILAGCIIGALAMYIAIN